MGLRIPARKSATAMAIGGLALGAALSPSAAVAAFPGGNGLIAFSSRTYSEEGLFTIRPDGSGLRQLTSEFDFQPSWSADGRRLVFARLLRDTAGGAAVFTINADGSDPTRVGDTIDDLAAPSFSPSGRRIVYTTAERAIHTVRTDGTDDRRILAGLGWQAEYSPDGRRIVFAGRPKGGSRFGIWSMRRDGSRLRHLADSGGFGEPASSYSPDGRHIVFIWQRYSDIGGLRAEIRVMRADGSRERPISISAGLPGGLAYAPAGDRIALELVYGETKYGPYCSDLFTISPTGSDRENLTNDCDPHTGFGGFVSGSTWQPDPPSTLIFGKVKKNRKRGTAELTVEVFGPGELELAKNKKLNGKQKSADGEGTVKLPIKPRRKAKKKLNRKGKAKVKAKVTYTPDGGPPNTQSKKVGLKKKR